MQQRDFGHIRVPFFGSLFTGKEQVGTETAGRKALSKAQGKALPAGRKS
jgi:hypothetical protein